MDKNKKTPQLSPAMRSALELKIIKAANKYPEFKEKVEARLKELAEQNGEKPNQMPEDSLPERQYLNDFHKQSSETLQKEVEAMSKKSYTWEEMRAQVEKIKAGRNKTS